MLTQHAALPPTVEQIVAEVNAKGSEVTSQERDIFLVAVTCEGFNIGNPDVRFCQPYRGLSFLNFGIGSADFRMRAFSSLHAFFAAASIVKFGNTRIQIQRGGQ